MLLSARSGYNWRSISPSPRRACMAPEPHGNNWHSTRIARRRCSTSCVVRLPAVRRETATTQRNGLLALRCRNNRATNPTRHIRYTAQTSALDGTAASTRQRGAHFRHHSNNRCNSHLISSRHTSSRCIRRSHHFSTRPPISNRHLAACRAHPSRRAIRRVAPMTHRRRARKAMPASGQIRCDYHRSQKSR